MAKEKAPFTVSVRFLRLLAHHLFGDSPAVVLRELVQNAHDAVLIRAASVPDHQAGDWRVRIIIDESQQQITILDDGIGMDDRDIIESLTCLGAGRKGDHDIKQLISTVANPEMLKNVVGYFGFGFIASTMISTRIEIYSHKEGCDPVCCTFDEGEKEGWYEIKSDREKTPAVGTRIVLHVDRQKTEIKDDVVWAVKGGNLLNLEIAERILVKYCDLLQFDVMLGPDEGNLKPVNAKTAPWERGKKPSKQDKLAYFKRRFGEGLNDPIDALNVELTSDVHNIDATGVLYVPKPAPREPGKPSRETLEVFVKRIWVCDDDFDILPEWARFFRGVIVSPSLMTRMDRAGLDHLDKSYTDLQIALRECLRRYLVELAQRNKETLQSILDDHGHDLRVGLLRERSKYEGTRPIWFADLIRILPFRTYSRTYPAGDDASLNDLLKLAPTAALVRKDSGEKHELHGVSRVVPPAQLPEFRKVLADKTYPIIVPENDVDLALLGAIGHEFEDVLSISDVEFRFGVDFVEPLEPAEHDRWLRFVEFVSTDMLRYKEKTAETVGEVKVGKIPKTDLPMLIHWKDRKIDGLDEPANHADRTRYQQITTMNAGNPFLKDLLAYVEEREIRRIERSSLVGNSLYLCYYLALIEQHSSMQKEQFEELTAWTMEMLKLVLNTDRELDDVKTKRDNLEQEVKKRKEDVERLTALPKVDEGASRIQIPEEPKTRTAAIVVVDLIRSTQILGTLDFASRPGVFGRYATMLQTEVERRRGFFDKFTGDGIIALFGVEQEKAERAEVCQRAVAFAQQARVLTANFGDDSDVRPKLHELGPGRSGQGLFACRVAISYGHVGFGRFGGQGSAVGTKMVEVSRVCSEADLYGDMGGIIVTADVFGALGAPKGLELVKNDFQPRGLLHSVDLYRLSS
mgnify:CR=1 FL=1